MFSSLWCADLIIKFRSQASSLSRWDAPPPGLPLCTLSLESAFGADVFQYQCISLCIAMLIRKTKRLFRCVCASVIQASICEEGMLV